MSSEAEQLRMDIMCWMTEYQWFSSARLSCLHHLVFKNLADCAHLNRNEMIHKLTASAEIANAVLNTSEMTVHAVRNLFNFLKRDYDQTSKKGILLEELSGILTCREPPKQSSDAQAASSAVAGGKAPKNKAPAIHIEDAQPSSKKLKSSVEAGSVVWAKLGSDPFWPALVCEENDYGQTKVEFFGSNPPEFAFEDDCQFQEWEVGVHSGRLEMQHDKFGDGYYSRALEEAIEYRAKQQGKKEKKQEPKKKKQEEPKKPKKASEVPKKSVEKSDSQLPNKKALVVGMVYSGPNKLKNPVNDAKDMAKLLSSKAMNFNVTVKTGNLSIDDFKTSVFDFHDSLEKGDVALFYFAGHGCEYASQNWLLATDIPSDDRLLDSKAVNARFVLQGMQDSGALFNVLLLDCCRSIQEMRRSTRSIGAGLAGMTARGSIIAYACDVNQTAADGDGNNGVFTEQLLQHLPTPATDIDKVLRRVGMSVEEITGGTQNPYVNAALRVEDAFIC